MAEKKPSYWEQLRDPRWQRRRLEIQNRDDWSCLDCGETSRTLNVHHGYYLKGAAPWEYPDDALMTLCEKCHEERTRFGLLLQQLITQAKGRRHFDAAIYAAMGLRDGTTGERIMDEEEIRNRVPYFRVMYLAGLEANALMLRQPEYQI